MASKTINVSVQAYELLKGRKRPKESFTDVIVRLAQPSSLLDLAGVLSDQQADELMDAVRDGRRRSMDRAERQAREWWT